jgi:hypothetical protein
MKITVAKVKKSEFNKTFITLWNGGLKLTEKEQDVLLALIESYQRFEADGLREPYISKMLFATDNRKKLLKVLGLTPQAFNNYFKGLKDKRAIFEEDDSYVLNPLLVPTVEIGFKFELYE